MKKILMCAWFAFAVLFAHAQDIPEHISYTRIYDFLDELANDGYIELNSVAKPYSRAFIASELQDAVRLESKMNSRQRKELHFFLNEFSLELNQLPNTSLTLAKSKEFSLAFIQPAFSYKDSMFRARITPILGMDITKNAHGTITHRWYGADLQMMIAKNLTIYGSLRDNTIAGPLLSKPTYLNDLPGYEYKESTGGGDYSDSRGGIKYAFKWGSVGLVKDNVEWGDNYHGSNILSGRAPSFPMITLHLKPAKWFEMQYFHGWLVSNVIDSTRYYIDNTNKKEYRMANKFIAANLFTITPFRKFNFSFGNSIIYAEQNIQPAYLIPVAFYKSIDHTLTKGLGLENQNSQVFFNISSRNIRHLHLFTSVFADEIMWSRFSPSSKQKNPISYKVGGNLSNFPIQNLSFTGEFTRTGIITYKHSIPALTWASNNYNLGHYMGDNSQEIYAALGYKPLRGLDVNLSYIDAKHGNDFKYDRKSVELAISQPVLNEILWSKQTIGLNVRYEVIHNAYAIINVQYSNIKGYDLKNTSMAKYQSSDKLLKAQDYLNLFTPAYLQGKNTTVTVGFSFGF